MYRFNNNILKSKKVKWVVGLTVIIIMWTYYVILWIINSPKCSYEDKGEDLSCHYLVQNDDLMTADSLKRYEEENENYNIKQIFFHETSCKGALTARQACSVESAARSNPEWDVHVLFSAPVSGERMLEGGHPMTSLIHYYNIKYWRVHVDDYVVGTPVEKLVVNGKLDRSRRLISHVSEVLRFATLYKHPGMFLDLDMIVVQPLDALWNNFAVAENKINVSAGVMSFSGDETGRSLAADAIVELANSFDEKSAHNGPGVMTRVLKKRCKTDNLEEMTTYNCRGVSVYDPQIAYSIPLREAERYFQTEKLDTTFNTQMYHLWGEQTGCWRVPAGSLLQQLAQQYCPGVYTDHPDQFGG